MATRKFVITAGALATGLALAACGGSGGDEAVGGAAAPSGACDQAADYTGDTLHAYIGPQGSYPTEQQEWMKHIKTALREQTGADVEFEIYNSADEEQQKIQTSVVSGQGPDVYEVGTTFTPTAYASDAFIKMGDEQWEAIGGKDKFVESTLAMSGPSADEQIAVPFTSLPFVMAYNTDKFAAAGIDGPPQTWDELIDDAKTLTQGGSYGLSMAYKDNFNPWKFIWMFSNQYGNPLIDGDRVTLDDEAVARAYEEYFGFLTEDQVVNPASVNWTSADALADFAAGGAAIFPMTTPNALPTLRNSPIADSFALAPMPTVPPGETELPEEGVPAATIVSGQNLVVASYSDQQCLALEYVELVTSEEEQQHYAEVFGVLPTNAAAAETVAQSDPQYEAVLEAGEQARPTPFTGAWSEVQLGLTNINVQSLPDLSQGSVDRGKAQQMLADLQGKAQAAVDRATAAQ